MEKSKIKAGRPEAIKPGDRFGMLTVVSRAANAPCNHRRYVCRCECGNEVVVLDGSLRTGKTRSCGCLRRERMRAAAKAAAKAAAIVTSLYTVDDHAGKH